jgi:hypothetical protein
VLQQFGAADAFKEGEPQQQIYVGHKRKGMRGELRSQLVGRVRNETRTPTWCAFLLEEIAGVASPVRLP